MCNINTKSWNQPVSGFAKIQICSVLLVPPLVGHRTQTWYASTARWLSYCPYPCCVWPTPNLQSMLVFTCNYSAQSGDTSGNTPIQSWYTWRSFESSITKKTHGWRCQLRSPPTLPRKKTRGLIEESKSVTKVSNLRRFRAFDLCCWNAPCWGSPKENQCATYAIWLFKRKGWFNNLLQRFYSLQQHETDWESSDSLTGCICCSSNASTAGRNTQISRNSKEVEEPHKVFHKAHWELKVGQSYHKEFGVSVPDIGDIILEVHLLHSKVTSTRTIPNIQR